MLTRFSFIAVETPPQLSVSHSADLCQEYLESLVKLGPFHIETYVDSNELLYAVLLTPTSGVSWVVNYDLIVSQHRKTCM